MRDYPRLLQNKFQCASIHNLLVGNLVILYRLSIQLHALDTDALGSLIRR